jgi:hypothetical protein
LASNPSVMVVAAALAGRVMVVIWALLLSIPEPPQVAAERVPKVVTLVAMATSPLERRQAIVRDVFILVLLTKCNYAGVMPFSLGFGSDGLKCLIMNY